MTLKKLSMIHFQRTKAKIRCEVKMPIKCEKKVRKARDPGVLRVFV